MDKHEVVLRIEEDARGQGVCYRSVFVDAEAYEDHIHRLTCRRWFGTDKIGKQLKVTVEELQPKEA